MTARGAALLGGAAGALVTAAAAAVLAIAGVFDSADRSAAPAPTPAPALAPAPAPAPAPAAASVPAVGRVYRAVSAGVVSIRAGAGAGTGFVIDRRGRIVTNAHVVGSVRRVRVQF